MRSNYRAGQLWDGVFALDWLLILPLMILVAQEAPILCLPNLLWFPIVATLAGLDAWDQDVRGFLALGAPGMA